MINIIIVGIKDNLKNSKVRIMGINIPVVLRPIKCLKIIIQINKNGIINIK
jgi:hypothetical protein